MVPLCWPITARIAGFRVMVRSPKAVHVLKPRRQIIRIIHVQL